MRIVDLELKKKSVEEALAQGPRPAEYRAKGKPFLRILVRKDRVSLAVRMTHQGVRKTKVLGEYPYLGLKQFEQLGTELYVQFTQSAYPRLADVTFGGVFEELFVTLKEREGKTTLSKDIQLYRDYLSEPLGAIRLKDISSLDVVNALKKVSDTRSDAMYNHVRVLIVGVFKIAVAYNLTAFDPTRAVPPRKLDNVVDRYLTEPEVSAFIVACRSYDRSLAHLSLLLALLVGARIGNVISLRKADISSDFSQLTFRKTKSGRSQLVPVSAAVEGLIRHILTVGDPQSPYLFSSTQSRTGHISHPRKAFIQVCRKAGIASSGSTHFIQPGFPTEPVTIHGLRKTYATAAFVETGDIYCSSELMGHSSVEVTKRYAFVPKQRLIDAVNSTSSRLLGNQACKFEGNIHG